MARARWMWTCNVTRTLLRRAGRRVMPEQVPAREQDTVALARTVLEGADCGAAWVFKTHLWFQPLPPRSLFIAPRRDARDTLISYMRFMCTDFDAAREAAVQNAGLHGFYAALPAGLRLAVDYREIRHAPGRVARRNRGLPRLGSGCIGVWEGRGRVDRTRVQRAISDRERDPAGAGTEAEGILIRSCDGSERRFDPATGFQTGHVSDYVDGDWRTLLSPEQVGRMHEALGPWLERNGY
ncbi:MAG TPA: hypothetical protein VFZ01_18085 [Geminicoccaceae bacterium]